MKYITHPRLELVFAILSVLGIPFGALHGQTLKPGEWRAMTSMRSVRGFELSSDSTFAWAVTSGGAFGVNLNDQTDPIRTFRTTEGLNSNDLTAVVTAPNIVFFGSSTGSLDVVNISNGDVAHYTDIQNSDYANKRINSMTVAGQRVYLATGYGMTVFQNGTDSNGRGGYFVSTVAHIASLPQEDSVHQVIESDGYIYAVLQDGIAFARRDALLSNYSSWTLLPTNTPALTLAEFNGRVYVGTAAGLYGVKLDRSGLDSIALGDAPAIAKVLAYRDSLYILSGYRTLYATHDFVNYSQRDLLQKSDTVTSISFDKSGGLALSTSSNGLAYLTGATDSPNNRVGVYPNGPLNNTPSQILYSPSSGLLYSVNGSNGVCTFDPSTDTWTNYAAGIGNTPSAGFTNVLYDSIRAETWFSVFGFGGYFVKGLGVDPNPTWVARTNHDGLPGFTNRSDDGFVVPRQGMIDRDGRFVLTVWAGNGKGIAISDDDQSFTNLPLTNQVGQGLSYGCVTQDLDGNYWVGTESHTAPPSVGVFWVRADGSAYGNIPGGPGSLLPSPAINAIITDQDDEIWAGSQQGVQIISDPYEINSTTNPQFSIRDVKLLSQQVVHSMAVDGVGNKWIGTENGIFVVSPDGSDSIAHFSTSNSPLMDNYIVSLALDAKRGEAYAATPSGISRFSTIFKEGTPDYSSIRVYPNPVIQSGEQSPTVFIDGLVSGSTVKIFTLRGELVAAINGQSYGSTVEWNGRDDAGHALPSGMYIVSATSPQSGDNGEAKIVVVRK